MSDASEPEPQIEPPYDDRGPEPSAELLAALTLSLLDSVGPRLRMTLLECFGTPAGVLAAAPSELRNVPGIGPKVLARIVASRTEIDALAAWRECQEHHVRMLLAEADDYPPALKEIPDPPGVLYVRGDLLPRDANAVAIVGTRHATPYGLMVAERLASGLARAGMTIVSGLARGIDAAAHKAALAAGGRTIAVLASGVLNIYPPEHESLAEAVANSGAVVGESAPRAPPLGGVFPQRNRIISGLSAGVIVVEAPERSGALSTAKHAMEQGRDVFAVPGRIDSRVSHGCHQLLRDGAKFATSVDDVLEGLGHLVSGAAMTEDRTVHHPAEALLNEQEQQVLNAVSMEPTSIDEVVVRSGLPVPRVLATISALEMRRLLRRLGGNSVARL